MKIHLIAAVAENGVIGKDGGIPWAIPEDLQHFKERTMGHTIIMGRRTFESIGRPLTGRQNIVVTSTIKELAGCQIASSLKEAIELAEREQIFIIGGSMLYTEALPMADVLDLTFVHEKSEGDTFFPEINRELYEEAERKDFDGNPPYSFVTYHRKS